jgi:hypothetical protein
MVGAECIRHRQSGNQSENLRSGRPWRLVAVSAGQTAGPTDTHALLSQPRAECAADVSTGQRTRVDRGHADAVVAGALSAPGGIPSAGVLRLVAAVLAEVQS